MNKPCAYCGKSDTPRHNGHIISKSLYPASTPNQIQRPTVPECERCKLIWTDAETQFRNVVVIAGEANPAVYEKWNVVLRSFDKPSGKKWLSDLWAEMVPISTEPLMRHKIYPHKDASVNLVLRKIVRGFSAYHGLGDCIPDDHVWVGYVPDALPQPVRAESLGFSLGNDFVQYGYVLLDDVPEVRSMWLLRFFGSRDFMGLISSVGDAKTKFGPIFNP